MDISECFLEKNEFLQYQWPPPKNLGITSRTKPTTVGIYGPVTVVRPFAVGSNYFSRN